MGHDPNSAHAAAELSQQRPQASGSRTRRQLATDVPLDELDVRDAVLGDRLVLTEYGPDEPLELHRIERGRAALLGSFENAAAAWRALDDLDAPPPGS